MMEHPVIGHNVTAAVPLVINRVTVGLNITSCSLSIFGAVAIFVLYFKYPDIRTPSKTFLLFLTSADFLTATGNLVGVCRYIVESSGTPFDIICTADGHNPLLNQETLCVVQSFITVFSNLASFFWTAAISFLLLLPLAKEGLVLGRRFKIFCHIVCWTIPGAIAIAAVSLQKLGKDNYATSSGWCWIDRCVLDKLLWMLFTGKAWELAVYLITGVNYILLKCFIGQHDSRMSRVPVWERHARERNNDVQRAFRKEDKNFIYVPLILYALRIWGTIRFFIDRIDGTDLQSKTALLTMQGIGDSLQAFINFVVFFACDASVRSVVIMDIGSRRWQRQREERRRDEVSHLFTSESYSYSEN